MKTNLRWLLALGLLACTPPKEDPHMPPMVTPPPASTSPSTSAELTVGKPAPEFDVTASDGTKLKLSALKGKPVVLYFYPKDETPGCTKEACSFRDGWDSLQQKGVVMIGVSMDDDVSHKAFAEHYKLPFLLVSDPKGALAQSYGVTILDNPKYGKLTDRQTIVIGADGNVKRIYRKVDVTVHATEIQADLSS
jgi:peroxiredoxin Q/BCP